MTLAGQSPDLVLRALVKRPPRLLYLALRRGPLKPEILQDPVYKVGSQSTRKLSEQSGLLAITPVLLSKTSGYPCLPAVAPRRL